jgi:hypothetical protein
MDRIYELETELLALRSANEQTMRQNAQFKSLIQELEKHILLEEKDQSKNENANANANENKNKKEKDKEKEKHKHRTYTRSPKMQFYHAHKMDVNIVQEVRRRMAVAGLADYTIPWIWIKKVTDEEYERQEFNIHSDK